MTKWLQQLNRNAAKWLWCLVIIGLIAAMPLIYNRVVTEQSANQVEVVFPYSNIIEISNLKPNSDQFAAEQLVKMKQAGINSIAVSESTLQSLQQSKRIELFSPREAAALLSTNINTQENNTYLLFTDSIAQTELQPMIESAFKRLHIKLTPWAYAQQTGLIIEMPLADAALVPMGPDPLALKQLKELGFGIVMLQSNRIQPFSIDEISAMWEQLAEYGVKSMIIDGDAVPGYTNDGDVENMKAMTSLLNEYNINLAIMEMQKTDPKGLQEFTHQMNNNMLRLHYLAPQEVQKLTDNVPQQEIDQRIQRYADRLVLAVKDRNIRMILLGAKPSISAVTGMYTDPLEPLYSVLNGVDGAVPRIQEAGLKIGQAHPFTISTSSLDMALKILIALGSIALIALTLSIFSNISLWLSFSIGVVGSVGIGFLSQNMLAKLLAFGSAICIPTLTVIFALKWIKGIMTRRVRTSPWFAFVLFFGTSLLSMIGAVYIAGLLNSISYMLLIDQFIGVRIASVAPILLVGLYLLFYHEELPGNEKLDKLYRMLTKPITVLWVLCAGFALIVLLYYVSRTGNSGYASSIELVFRTLLENTFGVRPRTKEFLFAHPLFILGAFLALKKRPGAIYIMAIGVIGQASIVGTFEHLHTPLLISTVRVIYGATLGAVVGVIYILGWSLLERIWIRYVPVALQDLFTTRKTSRPNPGNSNSGMEL
ncbi:DUF5693 family protein [Paenibacillus marinisediminis]